MTEDRLHRAWPSLRTCTHLHWGSPALAVDAEVRAGRLSFAGSRGRGRRREGQREGGDRLGGCVAHLLSAAGPAGHAVVVARAADTRPAPAPWARAVTSGAPGDPDFAALARDTAARCGAELTVADARRLRARWFRRAGDPAHLLGDRPATSPGFLLLDPSVDPGTAAPLVAALAGSPVPAGT
ncbi:hypothetical protein [Kineococcus sp. SYSU DK004]|uniref:hypothetical protein n=1 Tax=Kineococcus sp. SYSU DK004 TaxID=3383125 RepID=UPI003D7CEBEF